MLLAFGLALAWLSGLSASAPRADGRYLYVSPAGHDTADGSRAHPWRSIQRAADVAQPGDTIVVAPGSYAGFRLTRSGQAGRPIVITGKRHRPRPVIEGGGERDVIRLERVRHVRLARLAVTGAAESFGAGVRVSESSDVSLSGLRLHGNRSFGAELADSSDVQLRRSRIWGNETGVQVSRDGAGVRLVDNDVFANDRMIVNDAAPNNDRGANGLVFYKTTGRVVARANRIWGNWAPSTDYGDDGGAFEIYAASRVELRGNVVWGNENVLETGTDRSGGCRGNSFVRNVAYGRGHASGGLILRCAEGMVVANNTLVGLDRFSFDVTADASAFGGSIERLRILNNVAVSDDRLHSIDSTLPDSVVIDRNLIFNPSGGYLAYVAGHGNTDELSELRSWTGQEGGGINAAPRFRQARRHDFRLRAGSPAIDRALRLPEVSERFNGRAPDLGRFEFSERNER